MSPLIEKVITGFKDYDLTITTNGTMLQDFSPLLLSYVDHLTISVDGMADNLLKLRQIDLEQITTNIRLLQEQKARAHQNTPVINLQTVLSTENSEDLYGIINLASELGVNKCVVSHLLPQSAEDKGLILYKLHSNDKLKAYFHKLRNYSFRKGIQLTLPNYELKTERRCAFIEDNATVLTASGHIVPCYRFSHNGSEVVFGREKSVTTHSFGHFPTESLEDIWDKNAYTQFRELVFGSRYPSCIDCDLAEGCDLAFRSELDCYGISPACGDCLWTRGFVFCP